MKKVQVWIHAFRLRTLPLSLSSVFLASFLAFANHQFKLIVFILAVTTTLFLQILSNLANDYGDSKKGTDNDTRIGPRRAVQSGLISFREMRIMVMLFVFLSLVSGIALIYAGTQGVPKIDSMIFLGLGILAIIAAIKYTVGKNPYGYYGWGDLFVFLFFGLTGLLGTYYLHAGHIPYDIFLPAASVGFLSVGVLNLNNMRDRENDRDSGKRTIVVMIGSQMAKVYHIILLSLALMAGIIYIAIHYHSAWQFIFLLPTPIFFTHARRVLRNEDPLMLDPELKKLALGTLAFSLNFGFVCLI